MYFFRLTLIALFAGIFNFAQSMDKPVHPVFNAIFESDIDAVKVIIDMDGFSILKQKNSFDTPLLNYAVLRSKSKNGLAIVKELLAIPGCIPACFTIVDSYGENALHEAASCGFSTVAVVRLLLDAGFPINAATRNGDTALLKAGCARRTEIVKELLERGAKKIHNAQGLLFVGSADYYATKIDVQHINAMHYASLSQ